MMQCSSDGKGNANLPKIVFVVLRILLRFYWKSLNTHSSKVTNLFL